MSQQDVTVTPVRVWTRVSKDRDLTLYLVGDWVIRWVVVVWDGTDRCIDVSARKVLKDGSLAARSSDVRFYRSDKIPAWLAPVIAEHTPEWAR